MSDYDLVIRGGSILDGSGTAAINGDLAIKDGVIAEIGMVAGAGAREINAAGALVTPGFVDIHTHYDGLATWANRMNPSSHHGVTTAVMGNCGVGFAPVRPADHRLLVELMEGVEDIPGTALHEGLPWAWESFPEYLDFLDGRSYDMDIATQLPHAALRVYVMGKRGADREAATEADIARMRELTAEAVRAGALGFSSSRTLNHRSITGEPTPSLTAAEAELVGIALGIKDAGRGVIEMISDFQTMDTEFDRLMSMIDVSGAPMSISLGQAGRNPERWRRILAKIDEANRQGRVVKGQVAPRAIGLLLGLTTNRHPFMEAAAFAKIADLPLEDKVARMRDPALRDAILSEVEASDLYERLWAVDETFDYEPAAADAIAKQATARGMAPAALAYDLMLENEGTRLLYTPIINYAHGDLECCREMILAEHTVMGLGDGGAHVGIICDASFVTFLLTHWGRDRANGRIDLPTLIKAQTRDTAAAVGLNDRGLLREGLRADVNVIDFDRLSISAPHTVYDLPSGAGRLEQPAEGFLATIVAGEVTYENGVATDALPGRLVRGQQG
ncbi:MAG: amidohydrolase family protein [Pseudomonadota bacterium]